MISDIHLTFDYELFLKKSGNIQNSLIIPTEIVLDLFMKNNIKSTFFIDIMFYIKLLELKNYNKNINLIKKQIQRMLIEGHNVELHIHPHWIDAVYCQNEDQWFFKNFEKYKFQDLKTEEQSMIFSRCVEILSEICMEIDKNYKISAFRAGGLCLYPYSEIINQLKKNKIFIDSSIAPYYDPNDSSLYSYKVEIEKDIEIYRFNSNPYIKDEKGEFIEIPISTYSSGILEKVQKKIYNYVKNSNNNIFGDGEGIIFKKKTLFQKITTGYNYYSVENTYGAERHLFQEKKKFLTFLSHPKLLSHNSIEFLEQLIKTDINFLNLNQILKKYETYY